MKSLCRSNGFFGCYANAWLWYAGARMFGKSYFNNELIYPICKKQCIKVVLLDDKGS